MCLTQAGRIIDVVDGECLVDVDGRRIRASTVLLPDVAVGDWVTLGAGWLLARTTSTEAAWLQTATADATGRRAAIAGTQEVRP